jgi:hypothetical protein
MKRLFGVLVIVLLLGAGCVKPITNTDKLNSESGQQTTPVIESEFRTFYGEGYSISYNAPLSYSPKLSQSQLLESIDGPITISYVFENDSELSKKIASLRLKKPDFTSTNGIRFQVSYEDDGAAGSSYHTYRYTAKNDNYYVILEFVHRHCNVCENSNGNIIPFNEAKDTKWIKDSINSFHFSR